MDANSAVIYLPLSMGVVAVAREEVHGLQDASVPGVDGRVFYLFSVFAKKSTVVLYHLASWPHSIVLSVPFVLTLCICFERRVVCSDVRLPSQRVVLESSWGGGE